MKKKNILKSVFVATSVVLSVLAVPVTNVKAQAPYESICSEYEWEELKLTNQQRASQKVPPLTTFDKAQKIGDIRSKELIKLFSHDRPDGSSCFTVYEQVGLTRYGSCGENIAAGYSNPQSVANGWWNSQGHKENILRTNYKHVGIGYTYSSGSYYGAYWVQSFFGGCKNTKAVVKGENLNKVHSLGTKLSDMNLYAEVTCDAHGVAYMPVIDENCTGYDANKKGIQTVTLSCGETKTTFTVYVETNKPGKVSGVTASAKSSREILVKWKTMSNVDGYVLYRKDTTDGSFKKIKEFTSKSTYSFKDSGLNANHKYEYKLRAYVKNGTKKIYGSYSDVASAKTNQTVTRPGRVTGLSVTAKSGGKMLITWDRVKDAEGYIVYRGNSPDGTYSRVLVQNGNDTLRFTDTGLTPKKTYYYKVKAYKKDGSMKVYGAASTKKSATAK